jgi:AraC-like DNA-binding protein
MEQYFFEGRHSKSYEVADNILHSSFAQTDLNVLFNAFMFSGLSKLEMNQHNSGIEDLEKADSLFSLERISIQPYKRLLFKKLYEYHQENNNPSEQIQYLGKLISFDSVLLTNYQYFEPQLIRTIETPQLIAQKQAIINSLDKRRQATARSAWILGVFALVGVSGLVFYYQRQRRYKERFEALRSELEQHSSHEVKTKQQAKEISSAVIVEILGKLEQFEDERGYLDPDLNLNTVAKDFGTNAKYLSSVVNLKKGRNFSQYINTLRTEYALMRIRDDRLFRRYTIKAIAMEVGFNRAESFSKAFYRRYGIYPSYFIKQLELDADVDTLIDSVETSPTSP